MNGNEKGQMENNEDGRLSAIIKVSQDEEYRQELYDEYHIS